MDGVRRTQTGNFLLKKPFFYLTAYKICYNGNKSFRSITKGDYFP